MSKTTFPALKGPPPWPKALGQQWTAAELSKRSDCAPSSGARHLEEFRAMADAARKRGGRKIVT